MASMQGHPLMEIAEDLGYSESTAHRRIAEARAQLRAELAVRPRRGQLGSVQHQHRPSGRARAASVRAAFPPSSGVDSTRGPAR